MSANNKLEEPRVSARVNKEVSTPLGDVFVTYDPRKAEVVASFHSLRGQRVRYSVEDSEEGPAVRVRAGKRPPVLGDEITQNNRTFEVGGVRTVSGNRYQVLDDLGVWEDWQED